MSEIVHTFHATAFVENLPLKELIAIFPEARSSTRELELSLPGGGEAFFYPFGAVVFLDAPRKVREKVLDRLRRARPLTAEVVVEDFTLREEPGAAVGFAAGTLSLDVLTNGRAGIVALTVAQSAAMEYYERIVDQLFVRLQDIAARLELRGTVPLSTRPLHRFIAKAIFTRGEVLSVLHLLDKPDEVWEDPKMDHIYADLRAELDLSDRYDVLESKLRAVQEGLAMVLDVARDRRLVLLELAVVLLIVMEVVLSLLGGR
jgi:uncharacterized Rmd1/YagE family protein